MLCLLAWAAGIIDAVSYLGLGRVFTAMMTGNTVLLALAIGQGEAMAVVRSALALAGFSVGAATGALIVTRGRTRGEWPPSVTAALAVEAVLLASFTAVWHVAGTVLTTGSTNLLIVISGLAMGIQAAAVRHLGIPGVATTYLTGTLTSLMAELVAWTWSPAGWLSRAASRAETARDASVSVSWPQRIGLLTGVFFVYALGALAGGALHARSSALVAWLPLAAVVVVVANGGIRHGHAERGSRGS
jgi:uncharacterized membrane protein YoaK (UPF0700 family)